MSTETKSYHEDYESFINQYKFQEVHPEEIGLMIARMAQHFTRHNFILSRALKVYASVRHQISNQLDSASKPIAVSKADIIAAATPEAATYEEAKMHLQNIEQMINALKSLQKGRLFEYTHQ